MNSKRQLSKISIYIKKERKIKTSRLLRILAKFKLNLRYLNIEFIPSFWCDQLWCDYLRYATEVEYLSLNLPLGRKRQRYSPAPPKLLKLKRLEVYKFSEAETLFDAISNDSLEELTFIDKYRRIDDKPLQAFLNRQNKIKKLSLHETSKVNIDHLVLEKIIGLSANENA